MSYSNIILEKDGAFAKITLNRPEKMNALNRQTLGELSMAFEEIQKDDAVSGVLITGSGEKSFVAGADISEFTGLSPAQARQFAENGQNLFFFIENFSKPVVALVNGFALGGGCELAMACHIRIATSNAKFGQPEVNLGLIPGYGGTQRLPQLIGKGKALEILMTGDMISANEAHQLGLVNYVFENKEDAQSKALEILNKIAQKAPIAIAQVITATNAAFVQSGFSVEADCFSVLCGTEDFKEGTAAFLEKRKPNFSGK